MTDLHFAGNPPLDGNPVTVCIGKHMQKPMRHDSNNNDGSRRHELLRLGQMIRAARKRRGLAQARLAELSAVSAKMISLCERGQRSMSWPTLARMMAALRFRVAFIPLESQLPCKGCDALHGLQHLLPDLRKLVRLLEQVDNGE